MQVRLLNHTILINKHMCFSKPKQLDPDSTLKQNNNKKPIVHSHTTQNNLACQIQLPRTKVISCLGGKLAPSAHSDLY